MKNFFLEGIFSFKGNIMLISSVDVDLKLSVDNFRYAKMSDDFIIFILTLFQFQDVIIYVDDPFFNLS